MNVKQVHVVVLLMLCIVFQSASAQKKYSLHVHAFVDDSSVAYGQILSLKNRDTIIYGVVDLGGILKLDSLETQNWLLTTGYGYCKRFRKRIVMSADDTTRVFVHLKQKRMKKVDVKYDHLCNGCIQGE